MMLPFKIKLQYFLSFHHFVICIRLAVIFPWRIFSKKCFVKIQKYIPNLTMLISDNEFDL